MPQLDFSTWIGQISWLFITFFSMYFLVSLIIIPRFKSIILRREEKIDADLKKAEKLRKEAQATFLEYEKILEDAQKEASEIIKNTEEDARATIQKITLETEKRVQKKVFEAISKIKENKANILLEADNISSTLAKEVIEKITNNDYNNHKTNN